MTPSKEMQEYVLRLVDFKIYELQKLVKNNEGERKQKWEKALKLLQSHRTEFLKLCEGVEADLVSFGSYLLSAERDKNISEKIKDSVTHADIENWKHKVANIKNQ